MADHITNERWSSESLHEASGLVDPHNTLLMDPDPTVRDWSYGEVATLMGISVSSVRNHLSRGLERLRTIMEVEARA